MDTLKKELLNRKDEIKSEIKAIFEANQHITGWDVPEVDDKEASKLLLKIMQESLDEIKNKVLDD